MDNRVEKISQEMLTPLVRQALGQPKAVPASWETTILRGGTGSMVGGTALYRVSGQTENGTAWSVILKVLYERPGEAVESPYYWKREFELYHSRLLDTLLETGLTTPKIYVCQDYADACWIWMEDIEQEKHPQNLNDLRLLARRLGRFNGAYLTGHPLPDQPWLSDQWHCSIVPPLADVLEHLDDYMDDPLAQRVLPLAEKAEIERIWQERERFIEALASLPKTFCHLDVFPGNVFHSETQSMLVDWALAGRAAVGEELVCLVSLSLYSPKLPLAQAPKLDQTIFEGYMDGLRDAGWTGDAGLARLGYTCAMALRGLAGVKQDLGIILDEGKQRVPPRFETLEEMADFWADLRRFRLISMAKEARELLEKHY